MIKYITLALTLLVIQGCSTTKEDPGLRSPCVAADIGSDAPVSTPCGPRRPVNQHWLG